MQPAFSNARDTASKRRVLRSRVFEPSWRLRHQRVPDGKQAHDAIRDSKLLRGRHPAVLVRRSGTHDRELDLSLSIAHSEHSTVTGNGKITTFHDQENIGITMAYSIFNHDAPRITAFSLLSAEGLIVDVPPAPTPRMPVRDDRENGGPAPGGRARSEGPPVRPARSRVGSSTRSEELTSRGVLRDRPRTAPLSR